MLKIAGSAAAVMLLGGAVDTVHAALIANWGFEFVTPDNASATAAQGPYAPDTGAGAASGTHAGAANWSTPSGNGSPNSWSSTVWAAGDYYQFEVSTAGMEDVTITWDQTRSSTGPVTWDLQYATTTGGPFTTFLNDYTVPQVTWDSAVPDATGTTSFSADLSGVAALDNGSAVFRLVAQVAGSSTNGTSRVDNVVVSASPIPEPAGLAASALLLTCLTRRRRR